MTELLSTHGRTNILEQGPTARLVGAAAVFEWRPRRWLPQVSDLARAIQEELGLIVVFLLPRSQPWNFTWACWGDRRLGLARGCRWRGESRGDEDLERVAGVHLGPVQDQDHLACPRD